MTGGASGKNPAAALRYGAAREQPSRHAVAQRSGAAGSRPNQRNSPNTSSSTSPIRMTTPA
jgi:hypothetical protein